MFVFIKLILVVFVIFVVLYCIRNNVSVDFVSFIKKGFKLKKDKFGCYCFTRQTAVLGKTLSVLTFISKIRTSKQKVITNVKSYADNNPKFCIYEDNFYSIIEGFKNGSYNTDYIIFFDEIFTLIEKGKLDRSILSFISQLRKRGVYLVTTAQEWLEINVTFRRYVRYQVDCKMLSMPFTHVAFSINEVNNGYEMKWDNLQNEYVSPRIKTIFRKCSKKIADSYDTFEVIKDVEDVNPIGDYKKKRIACPSHRTAIQKG